MGLFSAMTAEDLIERINGLKKDRITCYWMPGTCFYQINPKMDKKWALKVGYKPSEQPGLNTEYHKKVTTDTQLVERARKNLH